ncbi:MAG: peptidase S9 [Saprospiraceae bacterium]|nr:MAG: peptidase S9 [Saprospiraceae bacterium]
MGKKFSKAIILSCILLQGCSAVAQISEQDSLIPREVIFDLNDRKELIQLSPNASTIFYVKGAYQSIPDNRIYYRSIAQLQKESFFGFSGAVGSYEVLNQAQLLVRTLSPKGQRIELFDIEDSISTPIIAELYRSIRWLSFTKNKDAAAFVAMPFNAPPLLFTYNFNTKQMDTLSNVAQGHYPLFFDENLKVIAGEKIDQETGNKILAFYEKEQWNEMATYEWSAERFLRPGLKSIVGVSADGKVVYFTDNSNTDKTVLKSFNISSKQSKVLVNEQSSDLMPKSFIADSEGKAVAIANHYANRKWKVMDSRYKSDFQFLNEKFQDFQVLDVSNDFKYWLIEEMNGGANISYLYDIKHKTIKKLFSDHDVLATYSTVNRFYSTVSSYDGLQLPVQYYLSEKFDKNKDGIPDKKMPAIVYVHGGPWQGWMEDFWLITRHLQLLADRGYLVVYSQFRGALTYGKNFLDAGNEEWGDGMMKDKVAIAHWLAATKNVEKDKIGIFGWSYGGYAALAGAAFSPETFACAVSLYGPTYLDAPRDENAFGYSPNSLVRIADVTTEKGLELAHQHSPLYAVDKIKIPILMSTGVKDDRVPQMQMDKMADALHKHNKEVTYFVYPQEGHDYSAKESWTSFWSIAEPFLSKHLGALAEPKSNEDYSILEMKYPITH